MCGIAGYLGRVDEQSIEATQRMLDALLHRGPDQSGLWCSDKSVKGAILGHRRLSIIDLSEAGRQPMVHEATGVALSYNGECYNYLELRSELIQLGYKFVSNSDTEVVLFAYVQWGEAAIERMRGMFAIVFWDPRDQSMLLVRDRLGVKPLYYSVSSDGFLFASEVRALLATDRIERKIDPSALSAYLWHGFVPGPRTIVRDIKLLDSGCSLRVNVKGAIVDQKRYWQIPQVDEQNCSIAKVDKVRDELEQAISLRMLSDVPLGVFLSGGVDSSVVTALAQRSTSTPVKTFNIRFEEARFDESEYARTVSTQLGTDHHEMVLNEATFKSQLDDALGSIDQPTFDAINTYFVSRAVKEAGLTVALAGTGGDELFAGYSSFKEIPKAKHVTAVLGRLPSSLRSAFFGLVLKAMTASGSEIPPQTRWGKLDDLFQTKGNIVGLYQVSYALFTQKLLNKLNVGGDEQIRFGLYPENYQALSQLILNDSALTAVSKLELMSFIGERLLRDTDAASMAVSLEVRVPLLDHQFVEAWAQLPESERYYPLQKKTFLKKMVAAELDLSIFERKKAGFELPLGLWCKRSLSDQLRDTFEDQQLASSIGLDSTTLQQIWRTFENGAGGLYWSRIWSLYILMGWCRDHRMTI